MIIEKHSKSLDAYNSHSNIEKAGVNKTYDRSRKASQWDLELESKGSLRGEAKVLTGEWVENIRIYTLNGYIAFGFF